MRSLFLRVYRALADRFFWMFQKRALTSPLTDAQLEQLNRGKRLERYVHARLAKPIAHRDLLAAVMVALRTGRVRRRITSRPGAHLKNASNFGRGVVRRGLARILQISATGADGVTRSRNGDPAAGYAEYRRDYVPRPSHGRGRLRRLAKAARRGLLSTSPVALVG